MRTRNLSPAALARMQTRIADRACICDIECAGTAQADATGRRWYDVRPMVDEREHDPRTIDMAREAIDYALARGLIERNVIQPHLVRIVRMPK